MALISRTSSWDGGWITYWLFITVPPSVKDEESSVQMTRRNVSYPRAAWPSVSPFWRWPSLHRRGRCGRTTADSVAMVTTVYYFIKLYFSTLTGSFLNRPNDDKHFVLCVQNPKQIKHFGLFQHFEDLQLKVTNVLFPKCVFKSSVSKQKTSEQSVNKVASEDRWDDYPDINNGRLSCQNWQLVAVRKRRRRQRSGGCQCLQKWSSGTVRKAFKLYSNKTVNNSAVLCCCHAGMLQCSVCRNAVWVHKSKTTVGLTVRHTALTFTIASLHITTSNHPCCKHRHRTRKDELKFFIHNTSTAERHGVLRNSWRSCRFNMLKTWTISSNLSWLIQLS